MAIKQIEIDRGWDKILKQHKLKEIKIEVGLWGSGNNPKNNLAYRALLHQEPSPSSKIPRRPFMSNAMNKNESKIKDFGMAEYRKVVDGKQTLIKAMDRIGVMHEGQMKKSFTEFTYVPNALITIVRKKSSRPLIDKSDMRNTIKYKVKTK